MKLSEIPQLTRESSYAVDVPWKTLRSSIDRYKKEYDLNLLPDYQRGHVWNEAQQTAYVENMLRGMSGVNTLKFNFPGWMGNFKGPFEVVDGLQRLTAALKFVDNELPAFELKLNEFEDKLWHSEPSFRISINNLKTRKEVLQWYIELNSSGVVHSKEEIDRVKLLLISCNSK